MHVVFTRFRRPKNPLVQLLLGLAAIGLLLFFSVFALFAAAGVLAVMGLMRAWRALTGGRPATAGTSTSADIEVIEGEFTVVRDAGEPAQRLHRIP